MDSTPATKADLDALEKRIDRTLEKYATKEDLTRAINGVLEPIAKLPTSEDLARAFNVALEQMRIMFGVVDDKHTHRSDELRRDLDAHRADTAIHRALRVRKTGSR